MAEQMVILDSCILIEIQRGNKQVIEKIYSFDQQNIFITPVVVAEFYRGARDKNEFAKCRKLASKFSVLSINEDVVKVFEGFFEKFSISHRPSIPDMLIAATSLHYNIPLYTDNKKDFQFIPNLNLL